MSTAHSFMSAAPDDNQRESLAEFHRRGEAAWQEYLRTGYAVPADDLFARLQAMLDARRAALATRSDQADR